LLYDFGRESEFERMYEDYFSKIYNYIFYRLLHREQTEELVSDIFLKVVVHLDSFQPGKASFNTWIFTIARNLLTDYYRKSKIIISIDDEGFPESALAVDIDQQCRLIEDEERQELYRALVLLNDQQRNVIALNYYGGFNNREISRITGINESTVSSLCTRGIKKLQTLLNATR